MFTGHDVSKNALTANGTPPQKTGDDIANGMAPELAAKQILGVIEGEKSEA